jgi:hypothetical protein
MRTRVAAVVVVLLCGARAARADVTVMIDRGTAGSDFAKRVGLDVGVLESQARTELEHLFQTYRLHDYLRALGDAQAFTTRGLGVDYGANFRWFEVGIAANVSVNAEKNFVPHDVPGRPPVGGLATNLTAMAGLNLGFLGLRPVTIYGNYFKKSAQLGDLHGDLQNLGVHLQIKLFGPERHETLWAAFLRWGGIDITTGLDRSRMTLTLSDQLHTDFPVGVGGMDVASINIDSKGSFNADMNTYSVPLELTTSFRLLYVLTIYGGGGFDWQLGGGSDLTMSLTGDLIGKIPSQGISTKVGSGEIVATDHADPSRGRLRGIFGLQATLFLVKVFTQVNFVPQDPFLVSVAFGARVLF